MAATLLGAHMPTAGGIAGSLRAGKAIGCDAIQVFTQSPLQWSTKVVTDEEASAFQAARLETGINVTVSHDTYLHNLTSSKPEKRIQSSESLLCEMRRCAAYGIPYVVSHMGASKGLPLMTALDELAEATLRLMEQAPEGVTLLMETSAGQGSALNFKFEQLAHVLKKVDNPALGICLDTCHIFVAGYDIRTEWGYKAVWEEFDQVIGLKHLKAIHCNDSLKPFGSRVDRHAAIGEGEIGSLAFELLVNDPRFENLPILLETPNAETEHARNLARLRAMIKS